MTPISDEDLARLWLRQWTPPPGQYEAPAARVTWDGVSLVCEASGPELSPTAALLCPPLARHLARSQRRAALIPQEPAIAALEADYAAATAPLKAGAAVAPEATFHARLAACRACPLWNETARAGRALCASVRCQCAHPLLWLAAKRCPESKWPEA